MLIFFKSTFEILRADYYETLSFYVLVFKDFMATLVLNWRSNYSAVNQEKLDLTK